MSPFPHVDPEALNELLSMPYDEHARGDVDVCAQGTGHAVGGAAQEDAGGCAGGRWRTREGGAGDVARMRAGVYQSLPGAWHFDIMVGRWGQPETAKVITGSDRRYNTQQEALNAACEWLMWALPAYIHYPKEPEGEIDWTNLKGLVWLQGEEVIATATLGPPVKTVDEDGDLWSMPLTEVRIEGDE